MRKMVCGLDGIYILTDCLALFGRAILGYRKVANR